MSDFSTGLLAFLKFQQDANKHAGPDVPQIRRCAGCGRAWDAIPDSERSGTTTRCWPCRHKADDQQNANGDGKCTEQACPRHGRAGG